jgi:hypothetical protein
MSNSIFEQLHVGTVSNLASFGSIKEVAVESHHVSALGHQAALGQPALHMNSSWLTSLSCCWTAS